MRTLYFLLFALLFITIGCKKDAVDATDIKSFQSSINDMATTLSTLEQIKFNEALYILKTFGVNEDGDINELKALSKLIDGKKIPEIFSLADQVAQKNQIDWSSNGPPSLGEMNIFNNLTAEEIDPNDINAKSLTLYTRTTLNDSIIGPKAVQIIPRLIDNFNKEIEFSGAALETILEVYSGGRKLLTSKNLMQNNEFKGFTVRFESFTKDQIIDNSIDATVYVKSTNKNYKFTKVGIPINTNALLTPYNQDSVQDSIMIANKAVTNSENIPKSDPKTTVQKFLNNINSQNLKEAYDASENPNWKSYDNFSNPTSGFGNVKTLTVKNISTTSNSPLSSSVIATYDVTDKNGNTSTVNVVFGLKNSNGDWKITSYKIN